MSAMNQIKQEKDWQLVVVLTVVCIVSAAVLSAVAKLTEEPIAKTKSEIVLNSIRSVLPDFANDPVKEKLTVNVDNYEVSVFPGKNKSGEIIGYAVSSLSRKGYGGNIEIMVGVLQGGVINKLSVIHHNETPGLGTKIESESFLNQFKGKSLQNFHFKVKKDKGDVDAITAATISSRAVTEAIELALKAIQSHQKQ